MEHLSKQPEIWKHEKTWTAATETHAGSQLKAQPVFVMIWLHVLSPACACSCEVLLESEWNLFSQDATAAVPHLLLL